ncbi:hypothetical protein DWB85_18330 [Seongchinamella sediminis]|uniref:Uncharacterized protein n=1 Tax=Seongchinamella sediminis TaxID=2283635 RepID=A0A3L7DU53_9GAMM|nr:hypothetical protein DWB85_18330 [Seongchinamella sediminis]
MNEEFRQRTRVARLYPDEASCLRLVSAVLMEIAERIIEEFLRSLNNRLEYTGNWRGLFLKGLFFCRRTCRDASETQTQ